MDCQDLRDQLAALQNRYFSILTELLSDPNLSADERKDLQLGLVETRETIVAVKDALEQCPTALAIVGVERTQAIQYFAINGQGSRYAPDNSVPLIAQRATVLRVYVASEGGRPPAPGLPPALITGQVGVDLLPANSGQTRHLVDLQPINGPIIGRPAAALDRGNADHTLNFRLAAVDCQGSLRFTIRVFEAASTQAGADVGGGVPPSDEAVIFAKFTPIPRFRIRGVMIHYTGDGMNLPPPTGLDLARTLDYSLRTYPIGGLEFGECIVQDFGLSLATPGAGCGPGWEGPGGLMLVLRDLEAATDDNDLYLGLIPPQARLSVGGCGNTGIAAAQVGYGETVAQELGHALGRKHAPAGGAPGPDPDYPTYGHYPLGSIGEFGFDVFTSEVFDPETTTDFMGYDWPKWVSPYTFNGLRTAIATRFRDTSLALAPTSDSPSDTLFLRFRVGRDDSVQLGTCFHLTVGPRATDPDPQCDVVCELLDSEGSVLAFQRCRWRQGRQDPDGPSVLFHEAMPWVQQATSIRILRGKRELHVHAIEPEPPQVEQPRFDWSEFPSTNESEDSPGVAKRLHATPPSLAGLVSVRWAGSHPDNDVTYMVRYSNHGGLAWRAVGVNLHAPAIRLPLRLLPGGDNCILQVVASSGVRTSVANSEPFAVPVRPREAWILSPESRSQVSEGVPVVLRGGAYSADFGLGDMQDVVWTSNRDGTLGYGFELVADRLSAGLHRLTISAPGGAGSAVTASVSIQVLAATVVPH